MKRFTGEIHWIKLDDTGSSKPTGSSGDIKRAILNENVFTIDHTNPEDVPDSEIKLRAKDGFMFDGSAKFIDDTKSFAVVNMEYYVNQKNAILTGLWVEGKVEFLCIIKLTEVDTFKN